MTIVFKGYVPALPPSVNAMYVHTRRGPVQSKALKQFKVKAKLALAEQIPLTYAGVDPGQAYKLTLIVHLPALENKGWPKSAKTRYKRRDVSNLIKVMEDVLSDSLGIDDANFVRVVAEKVQDVIGDCSGGITILLEEHRDPFGEQRVDPYGAT